MMDAAAQHAEMAAVVTEPLPLEAPGADDLPARDDDEGEEEDDASEDMAVD